MNKQVRVGNGNRIEMVNFIEEVKEQVRELNLNLNVAMLNIQQEKYGEMIDSKFFEVVVIGSEQDINTLINNN